MAPKPAGLIEQGAAESISRGYSRSAADNGADPRHRQAGASTSLHAGNVISIAGDR